MGTTSKIIALVTGVILVALAATGIQIFFVDMMTSYDVEYDDSTMNWTLYNEESYQSLKNTTIIIESEFDKTSDPDDNPLGGGSFYDTTWNSLKTAMSSVYNSLAISGNMIKGAGDAIPGVDAWLVDGLVVAVFIAIILLIIGWWMNRN